MNDCHFIRVAFEFHSWLHSPFDNQVMVLSCKTRGVSIQSLNKGKNWIWGRRLEEAQGDGWKFRIFEQRSEFTLIETAVEVKLSARSFSLDSFALRLISTSNYTFPSIIRWRLCPSSQASCHQNKFVTQDTARQKGRAQLQNITTRGGDCRLCPNISPCIAVPSLAFSDRLAEGDAGFASCIPRRKWVLITGYWEPVSNDIFWCNTLITNAV